MTAETALRAFEDAHAGINVMRWPVADIEEYNRLLMAHLVTLPSARMAAQARRGDGGEWRGQQGDKLPVDIEVEQLSLGTSQTQQQPKNRKHHEHHTQ